MKNLLLLSALLSTLMMKAQTPGLGSIAFTAMQCNAPDGFAFVVLQSIPANTSINFTDNGWDGSALFNNEDLLTWNSGNSAVAPGTWIYIYDDNVLNGLSLINGIGTVTGELPSLSSAGEQLLAFTGSTANPNFLAAISNSGFLGSCNPPNLPNTNTTCLPGPLEAGISAQAPNEGTMVPNLFFNQSIFNGSAADLYSALMNPENWTSSSDINTAGFQAWPDWDFNLTAPQPTTVSISQTSASLTEGAASVAITVELSSIVFQNTNIQLQLSGNLSAPDVSTSPSMNGNILSLTIAPGNNAASFTLLALADGITEATETGSITFINLPSGIQLGNPSTLALSVSEPNNTSLVNFSVSNESINESETLALSLIFSNPVSVASTVKIGIQYVSIGSEANDAEFSPLNDEDTLSFNVLAGSSSIDFEIQASDDLFPEADETIRLEIIDVGAGLTIGQEFVSSIVIVENDQNLIPNQLKLNEVMSSNTTTIANDIGEFSDWIELVNGGNQAIDLSGLYLTDDQSNPYKYKIPAGTSFTGMQAGSFKLLWADDSSAVGPLHLNFRISNAGEFLGLYAAANTPFLIDSVNVPALTDDQSWGRVSDGNGIWKLYEAYFTTPEVSNELSGLNKDEEEIFTVFPNPAQNFVNLKFATSCEVQSLKLLDFTGRVILQLDQVSEQNQDILSLAGVPPGVYNLIINTQRNQHNTRLIRTY